MIQRQIPFNAVNMPSIDLLDTDIMSHADYNTVKHWTTRKFNSRYEKSSNKKDIKAFKFLNLTRFFCLRIRHIYFHWLHNNRGMELVKI